MTDQELAATLPELGQLLNAGEVATRCRVHLRTVRDAISSGHLHALRFAGRVLISERDLKEWKGGYIRNGIYIIDRQHHRHKISTRCTTKRGALAQLEEYESDPEGYVRGARQRTDLAEAVKRYLKHSAAKNSEAHAKSQGAAFDRWFEFLRRHREVTALQDLTASLALQFMEWRLAGGGGKGLKVSEASFNRDFAAMTALISWAHLSDLVRDDFNPFRKVHQLKEHKGVRPHREVPRDDFLAARQELPDRWADAVTVLYGTGFRWGSLARMTGDCIDDARKVIRDPRPKGKRAVEVPVSVEVLDAAVRCLEHGLPNDKAAQLSRRLTVACRAAGVARFTAHDLRVSAASHYHRVGMPLRDLQELLGHADLATTQRYVRLGNKAFEPPI